MSTTMDGGDESLIWTGRERRVSAQIGKFEITLKRVGEMVFRYGLAAILVWLGILKFSSYEAINIQPLIMNSPFFFGFYQSLGLQNLSMLIGIIEIAIGLLIATRAWWPGLSALGSMCAIFVFIITLSFMLTTPNVWQSGIGFPALSMLPGQFLLKDIVLLGVSIWSAGEALRAALIKHHPS